jgi:hypothetical protein
MRSFDLNHSMKLDWAITCMEATRGWRRNYWRLIKWYWELGI